MSERLPTDFERHGLAGEHLPVSEGSPWLLTVDFEAFSSERLPLWVPAMRHWSARARETGLRFSLFTSIEDVVGLRSASDRGAYASFTAACRELHDAGSRFHPHNHCLFDPDTAVRASEAEGFHDSVDGYPHFPSMVYDVARRHGVPIASWLPIVARSYADFMDDCEIGRPERVAFRAGGWDYGVTGDDMADYLDGVVQAGIAYDSSALCGTDESPGTTSTALGRNVFRIRGGAVEVAPTDHVNCGLVLSIGRWGAGRIHEPGRVRPGVRVTVIHIDHLFHAGRGASTRYFAVTDERVVRARIDRFFRALMVARRLYGLESVEFEDLHRHVPELANAAPERAVEPAGA